MIAAKGFFKLKKTKWPLPDRNESLQAAKGIIELLPGYRL